MHWGMLGILVLKQNDSDDRIYESMVGNGFDGFSSLYQNPNVKQHPIQQVCNQLKFTMKPRWSIPV